MRAYYQKQDRELASTSLCLREFVPLDLLLKDPGCGWKTHADPDLETQTHTHTHIDQVRECLLSQTSLDSQLPPSLSRPEHEDGIKGRALIIPSDSCQVSVLLSSLSCGLLVGGSFQANLLTPIQMSDAGNSLKESPK